MKQLLFYLLIVSGILCSCQNDPEIQKRNDRPNVVLILTDDQGYADVGVFGAVDFETPNLDQLANEGALLTHYYAPQAVCSASRAGILTGCYPNRIGIHNALMPNSDKGLHPDEMTIADMLKERGYATAIFGKWHLGDAPSCYPQITDLMNTLASHIQTTCGRCIRSKGLSLILDRFRSTKTLR